MKTNSFTQILLLSAAFLCCACEDMRFGNDFLEKAPSSDMDLEKIFSKSEFAEQALAEVYRSLPDGLPQDARLSWGPLECLTDLADYAKKGSKKEYYTGTLNSASEPQHLAFNWYGNAADGRSAWKGIRNAYIFLENVDAVQDMSEGLKAVRKGEAKAIIALHYLNMFRYYGGLPWADKAYSASDDFHQERLTAQEMIDRISGLLDEAAEALPWAVDKVDDGRMTRAGVMALKVRLLLFAASPLLNDDVPYMEGEAADRHYVWLGKKDPVLWDKVIEAGEAFMSEMRTKGKYGLVTNPEDPRQAYHDGYFKRANGEVLVSSHWHSTYTTNFWPLNQSRYGSCSPTLEYVDMFPLTDGSDFCWETKAHSQNPFFKITTEGSGKVYTPTRDPRLYETCIINDDKFQGRRARTFVGGDEYSDHNWVRNGFGMRKFFGDMHNNKGDHIGMPYQWPIMRLPEVYLSLAEAYNETGRPEKAYEYLKLIRDRVGMPNVKAGLDKEALREAILRERCLEFGYEEVRWFDLVRWKRSDIMESTAHCHRLEITRKVDKKTGDYVDTYAILPCTNQRLWAVNWSPKYFLTPFPVNEINIKYGLVQNPGF